MWYYLGARGEPIAVAERELATLAEAGEIRAVTLVWRRGQAGWLSCGEVKPELFRSGRGTLSEVGSGRSETAAVMRHAGLRPDGLRLRAGFLLVLAGAMVVSLVLFPLCWVPGIAGVRYLKAADFLDAAGRTGELSAWQLFDSQLAAAAAWLRGVIVMMIVVVLGLALIASVIKFGGMDLPGWLSSPISVESEVERR